MKMIKEVVKEETIMNLKFEQMSDGTIAVYDKISKKFLVSFTNEGTLVRSKFAGGNFIQTDSQGRILIEE